MSSKSVVKKDALFMHADENRPHYFGAHEGRLSRGKFFPLFCFWSRRFRLTAKHPLHCFPNLFLQFLWPLPTFDRHLLGTRDR
jgi:hypothetical protein